MFNESVESTAPYLLDGLYRLLHRCVFNHIPEHLSDHNLVPTNVSPSGVLHACAIAQLSTVLCKTLPISRLRRTFTFALPDTVSGSSARPDTIFAISGRLSEDPKATRERVRRQSPRCVFAIYLPRSDKADSRIRARNAGSKEGAIILQLEPRQDVFRGVVGEPEWMTKQNGDVHFGREGKGACLMLKRDHQHFTFRQKTPAARSQQGSYRAVQWRDDWSEDYDIEAVEVWEAPEEGQ